MKVNRNDLQHITTIQHEGRVLLLGIDSRRNIYYTIKQITPPTINNQQAPPATGNQPTPTPEQPVNPWRDWQRLTLPNDAVGDPSVTTREQENKTYTYVRSLYNTFDQTALAPIQAVSDGEHLYIFRQSLEATLLADRFVLDGGSDRLVPKLEVRFKRSRQKYQPLQPTGNGSNREFDSPDYRDIRGNFFFEPTTELRLVNNLKDGWFAAVLANTDQHDTYRWHIFAYNSSSDNLELISLRRSAEALFDLNDYIVEEGTIVSSQPRLIPGVIRRNLRLNDATGNKLTIQDAPAATVYALQHEARTGDGETTLMKAGMRVMLGVPVGAERKIAALSFAVRNDGTLAEIDEQPDLSQLSDQSQEILLPADLLHQIKSQSENRTQEPIIPERLGLVFDGIDDYIDVGNNRSLNLTNNFTIEAWILLNTLEGRRQIFSKENAYSLGVENGQPFLSFPNRQDYRTTLANLSADTWFHLAVVVDRSNTAHFYINGQHLDTISGNTPASLSRESGKIGSLDGKTEFWHGQIADVRLWDAALNQADIQQRRRQQLLGRELNLIAYWTLSAVVDGETVDFSLGNNNGVVRGAYPVGSIWERSLLSPMTQVTAYRYDEVFSVIQGGTYLESFEYRTSPANRPFSLTAEAFEFVFWGREGGRDGKLTEPIRVNAQIELVNNTDDGWRRAIASFTIPAGMTHLRYFHITPPGGNWQRIEVRRHRIQQVTETIKQALYNDEVRLSRLADGYADAEKSLTQIRPLEAQEAKLFQRLQEVIAIETALTNGTLQAEIQQLDNTINDLKTRRNSLGLEERNPFNRYATLRPSPRDNVRLHYGGNNLALGQTNNSMQQAWKFVQRRQGVYTIHSRYDENKVLAVRNNNPGLSLEIQNYTLENPFQQWIVRITQPGNPIALAEITSAFNPSYFLAVSINNATPTITNSNVNFDVVWALQDLGTVHPEGQTRINQDKEAVSELTKEITDNEQRRQERVNALNSQQGSLANLRTQLENSLRDIQTQIATLRNRFISQIANLTNRVQDLPVIPTNSGGIVKGAILDFASSAGRVTAYESAEASVQLNFFDTQGRIRNAIYDTVGEEWQANVQGTCLEFRADASGNSRVEMNTFGQNTLRELTIEAWIRTFDTRPEANIFSYANQAFTKGNALLLQNPRSLQFAVNGNVSNTNVNIADGEWHHITLTWQSIDGSVKLYKDGAVVYSGTHATGTTIVMGGTFVLGRPFMGFMDSVRVWTVALKESEIQANMQLQLRGDEPGILASWSMNNVDVRQNRVPDSSPNNYNGTIFGEVVISPSTAPAGVIPKYVMGFGERDSFIEVGNHSSLNLANNLTLEAWFNLENTTTRKRIFSKNLAYGFGVDNNQLIFTTYRRKDYITTKANLLPGRWYHVAVVMDSRNTAHFYLDGQLVESITGTIPAVVNNEAAQIGSLSGTAEFWYGQLADLRIWNTARTVTEIAANRFLRLKGNEVGLVAYWRLDGLGENNAVIDTRANNRGTVRNMVSLQPSLYLPIQEFNTLVVNEYPSQERNQLGQQEGLLRRFYAYQQPQTIDFLLDQRIEELEVSWIGNAQFDPTLLGYIEGAPPVPSENLTIEEDYNATSAVELNSTENVSFSWRRTQESGIGVDVQSILGVYESASFGVGAFGLVETSVNVEGGIGVAGRFNYASNSLDEGAVTVDIQSGFNDRLELRGEQEPSAKFAQLGRRFVPKNIGYALVVSSLADVYVLRLKRSRKMVSYQVTPVPDLPPSVNTITFLINPGYLMNGTLDGQIGTEAADDRFYRTVPSMRAQFGSELPASYFRIREANRLKMQIQKEDREREGFFTNFNSRIVEESAFLRATDNLNEENLENQTTDVQSQIRGQQRNLRTQNSPAWQRRLEDLLVRSRKRNIVNTYVWDGDGGFRSESQEFASTVEQTIGGTFELNGGIGVTGAFRGGLWLELTAMATFHLTQTMTKTEIRSQGFSLNVEVNGEKRGITRLNDTPIIPGEKVDRYSFSSYYLEPTTDNFSDFFNRVVDPEWLMSNDEEARALRQISPTRPNKTWRVRHLVTYVERPVLKGFGEETSSIVASGIVPSVQINGNGQVSASSQVIGVN